MLTIETKLFSLQGDILSGRLDRDKTLKVYFTISPTSCSVNFVLQLFVKTCVICIYYRVHLGKSALQFQKPYLLFIVLYLRLTSLHSCIHKCPFCNFQNTILLQQTHDENCIPTLKRPNSLCNFTWST